MKINKIFRVGLLAACVAICGPATAEEPAADEPTRDSGIVEQTEKRLVQLDVSLLPKKKFKGTQIPELEPEDFDLIIQGKQIEVEFADRICRSTTRTVQETIEGEAPATPPSALPPTRASYLFYFDHTMLTMFGQNIALQMAREMIPDLVTGGDRGMIISSGGKVLQSRYTTDPAELLEMIDEIEKDVGQWTEYIYAQGEEERYAEIMSRQTRENQLALARAYRMDELRMTNNRLRRLAATIGGLAETSPPKALFYFSDITRSNPGEHYLAPFATEAVAGDLTEGAANMRSFGFDDVLEQANAQGLRMYTVHAQGMLPPGRQRYTVGAGENNDLQRGQRQAQDTARSFARESGGTFFFGGSDNKTLARIVERVEQDLRCFYLLSFRQGKLAEDGALRVVLRLEDTERGRAAAQQFKVQTRGQLVIQSTRKREESLLLAAHVATATVDSNPGRGVVIPLGFDNNRFEALVQFVVRGVAPPGNIIDGCEWDLGMTHLSGPDVKNEVSGHVEAGDPSAPVVLETTWNFAPGEAEVVSVGREHRLGQLATVKLELDWPNPNKNEVSVTPVAVTQPYDAVFVRKTKSEDDRVRSFGTLGIGQGAVRVDLPTTLISLVCRSKRTKQTLWIKRELSGEGAVPFELLEWADTGERCVQVRDLVYANQMSWGDFTYKLEIFDDAQFRGGSMARTTRAFTALEADMFRAAN